MAKRRRNKRGFWFKLSHLFRPQKSNRYRSKLLHPQSLLVLSFILLAVFALFNAVRFFPSLADKVLGVNSQVDIASLLEETNAERVEQSLEPLVLNEELNQAALAKAQDMLNDQYWAHVAPDGKQAWDFIKEAGYSYKYAGENLARDFSTSQEVVEAWVASPSHYENIMNEDFTQMGLAVVEGNLKGFRTTIVVQLFAVPDSVAMRGSVGDDFYLPRAADPTTSQSGLVAGETKFADKLVFSPLNFTRAFFLVVVMLIALTLAYDALVAKSKRYERLVGQNFAHIALFMTVAFLLVLFKGGSVLP